MNKNVKPRELTAEEFARREEEKFHIYRSGADFIASNWFWTNVRRVRRQRQLDALFDERRQQRALAR